MTGKPDQKIFWAGLMASGLVLGLVSAKLGPVEVVANRNETNSSEKEENQGGEQTTREVTVAKVAESGTGIKLMSADDWAEKFPDEYNSFQLNAENKDTVDYLQEYPYLKDLYKGYGFAKSYSSARGHTYVIDDLYNTGRPHKLANCFTCKTSEYTNYVLNNGDQAYAMKFEDYADLYTGTDPFGCFHCHENEPGTLYVTHGYVAAGMDDDQSKVDGATLSCAQCHTEYYFDPSTSATSVAYHGLDKMGPDAELEYENSLTDKDGNLFCDWVDEDTGTRKLKVQHPEFETFVSGSIHYMQGLTCADCHMSKKTDDSGKTYTSHDWVSPLKDESIMTGTCAKCHGSDTEALKKQVKSIQENTIKQQNELADKIVKLDADLAAAISANKISGEDLEKCRMAYRNAQWYWDYVFVENSDGFHNNQLTSHCFEKCESYLKEANSYLGA